MSNTIGSAVIEVGVDSRGVEAGFAKMDGAIAKTGKSLDNLGERGTKGFGDIGAGGDMSAKKVEAATKNMIGAIQRTTASMESGSKTSAKYYETLANQRGVNIEALRPYLAQLDAVKAKQEAAAKATTGTTATVTQLGGAIARVDGIAKTAGSSLVSFGKSFILGAAVGMSYDAIKGKIFGVLDGLAGLKTLSEKTGASVEGLSKLGFAAKQSGSDIANVGGALTKLAKGMAGADADSKGAGLALKYLGLNAKDAAGNLKDPADMFVEIAKKLALYEDGAGKVALAQALLGKSGADMLPTLKLLGEQSDISAKATDAQATAARQYQRDLAKLDAQKGMLFKTIAVAILPAMSDFAGAMLDASKNVNITNAAVKGLADDNSMLEWADAAAVGLARVVDVITLIPRLLSAVAGSFKVVGADIETMGRAATLANPASLAVQIAQGNNPYAALKKSVADRDKILADANAKWDTAWNTPANKMEQAMLGRIAGRNTSSEDSLDATAQLLGGGRAKLKANFDTSGEDGEVAKKKDAALAKEAGGYTTLIAAMKAKTAEDQLELASGLAATENQKFAIKLNLEEERSKKNLTAAGLAKLGALKAEAVAALAANKAAEDASLARQTEKDVSKYIEQSTAARNESTAALEVENQMYGKSADARALAMLAVKEQTAVEKFLLQEKTAGKTVTVEQIAQLNAEAAARVSVERATLAQSKALGYASQLAADNKRFAAESIFDEKGRAAALLEIDAATWRERIALAGAGTEAQKRLQGEYSTWYENQLAKPQIESQKKIWASIDSTAHDTFVNIFNGGKNAFDRLRDTLKSGLLDLLYQMTVKKWIFQIGASVTGSAGVPGMAQAMGMGGTGGGAGGAMSLLQTAKGAYDAISSGFANVGTSVAEGVQSGLNMLGPNSGFYSAAGSGMPVSGLAQGAGVAGSYLAGASAGKFLGSAISGEYGIAGHGSAVVNIGTVAGAIFGGPIGAAIGGAIGGLLNRTFGMGAKKVTEQGIAGTLGDEGFTGTAYSKWKQKGGLFRSDKGGNDKTDLDAATATALGDSYKALKTASAGFATALGVNADSIAKRTQALNIVLGKDAATNQKAITDFFVGVGDAMAKELVPNLNDFALANEAASTTLQRIAGDYQVVDSVLATLGKTSQQAFGAVGMASVAARERLVAAAGSLDALASGTAYFASNFLTPAEQMAPIIKNVEAQLAGMGAAGVKTNDQFKALVLGLNLSTDAGAKQYAQALLLAPQFKQMTDYTTGLAEAMKESAEVLSQRADLQNQLDGLTLTSAQMLAKQRAALDASNRGLWDQVQAATAAKAAQDSAKTALQGVVDKTGSFAESLRGLRDGLNQGSLSTLTPMQKYDESKAQYERTLAAAKGGDATAQGNFQSVATAFLTASQLVNASSDKYAADYAGVMQTTAETIKWAEAQVDVGRASLAAFDKQVLGIVDVNTNLLTIAQAIRDLQIARGAVDGSHAGGLASVPWDGYRAELHHNEVVMDAPAVSVLRRYFGGAPSQGGNTDALVAEIKALRDEVKGLRADQAKQTGDLIATNYDATDRAAGKAADGAKDAAKTTVWAQQSKAVLA